MDTVYCVHVAETISLPIMTVTEPLSIPADDWVQKTNGLENSGISSIV